MYNPNHSASWYPGKGIYRNVSLTKTAPVHVVQWGTFTTTPQVSAKETTIHLSLKLENKSTSTQTVEEKTQVFATAVFGKSKDKVITNFQQKLLPKKEVKAK